jgi:hypothetical protein
LSGSEVFANNSASLEGEMESITVGDDRPQGHHGDHDQGRSAGMGLQYRRNVGKVEKLKIITKPGRGGRATRFFK